MTLCRLLFVLIALYHVCFIPSSAQVALPSDYQGPVRVDLSGIWDLRLDNLGEGETQRWFEESSLAAQWRPLHVPGSFNDELAPDAKPPDAMRFFKGAAWYRTHFSSPIIQSRMRVMLHLSGTVLRQTIWLNGKLAGSANLPYLENVYDVTPWLRKDAPNLLVVRVENTIPVSGIPDKNWHGWWDEGGLIRPVYLELRPHNSAQSYVTTTMEPGGWRLNIETAFDASAPAGKQIVRYSLSDNSGNVIWNFAANRAPRGSEGRELRMSKVLRNIEPWSPEHPALYSLTTSVGTGAEVDNTTVHIGFRQVAVRGTQIMLNGQPYRIWGLGRHQFLSGSGMSLTVAQNRRDIEDIKSLGANFVRLAHYSQSQDVYDACDELGLLVWTEIPAWQSSVQSLSDARVWKKSALPQLSGMVAQHRNHPSVVIWSVANEIPSETEKGAEYVAKAIAYVKSLDRSRLVTFASDRRLTDKAFGTADIIAINEYFAWYYGKQSDVGPMLDQMHAQFPGKPVLVSEFGADGVADWSSASVIEGSRDYSFTAQADFLATHMEQIFAPERKSFVAGGLIWLYNDFPDPSRIGGDHPQAANYRNNKGLVTSDRVHKPAYDVVQKFFHHLAMSENSP